MCPTYSAHLYVPAGADDTVVRGSAKFRSKGRLPALSYYYAPKKVSCAQLKMSKSKIAAIISLLPHRQLCVGVASHWGD